MSQTGDLIIQVVQEKHALSVSITAQSSLTELGLDSLDIINVLFTLEEKTGVKIPDEAIAEQGLDTIAQFAAYIDQHRST